MLSEQYFRLLILIRTLLASVWMHFEGYSGERIEVGKCSSSTDAKTPIVFTTVSLSI